MHSLLYRIVIVYKTGDDIFIDSYCRLISSDNDARNELNKLSQNISNSIKYTTGRRYKKDIKDDSTIILSLNENTIEFKIHSIIVNTVSISKASLMAEYTYRNNFITYYSNGEYFDIFDSNKNLITKKSNCTLNDCLNFIDNLIEF